MVPRGRCSYIFVVKCKNCPPPKCPHNLQEGGGGLGPPGPEKKIIWVGQDWTERPQRQTTYFFITMTSTPTKRFVAAVGFEG